MKAITRTAVTLFCFMCTYSVSAAENSAAEQPPDFALVFSGFDFNSQGSYTGFMGGNFAPGGNLETSGVRFSVFSAGGVYRYSTTLSNNTPTTVKGVFETGDVLLGYGFNAEAVSAKLMFGLNMQDQQLNQTDPNNPVQGSKVGAKVQGDLYWSPTEQTMFFGLASFSEVFRTYYSEAKFGYELLGVRELYIGPQAFAQGNLRYDQWRVGGHITGIKIGAAELGFSAGYLRDSQNGPGTYGQVTLDLHF